jgi:hypothetical protein
MRGILFAAALVAGPIPAIAAPVAAADATVINGLVQKTWARFGTTGVPRGPRFDPPRTPAFARALVAFQKRDPDSGEPGPDNVYCMCFNEYRPHLTGVTLNGVSADVVEARTTVSAGGLPTTVIWRFVRSPQGWLLDDVWEEGGPISVQRRPIRNGRRQ